MNQGVHKKKSQASNSYKNINNDEKKSIQIRLFSFFLKYKWFKKKKKSKMAVV